MKTVSRLGKIARSRFKELTLKDFIKLAGVSLFRNDSIIVYSLDLSNVCMKNQNCFEVFNIRKGNLLEIDRLRKNQKFAYWEFYCDKYDGVKDFYISVCEEVLQHISWIYYKEDPNRILRLGDYGAEIKYCLTIPEYRGKGIYPKVLTAIACYLKKMEFKHLFICVEKNNIPSIRGIEKAGFKVIKKIKLIKLFGVQLTKKFDVQKV